MINFLKFKRTMVFLLSTLGFAAVMHAQNATWIWYPGDFEVWLSNKMQNRRTERGAFLPPFWKLDNHYVLIDFHKDFVLSAEEQATLWVEGNYNVKIDGKLLEGSPSQIKIPAGKHRVNIKVFNQAAVPAIFVQGQTVVSDSSWRVTFEDKEWIDETGKASDQSGTTWLSAGYWNFNQPAQRPSSFHLPVVPQSAASTKRHQGSLFMDFGKETFGFVRLHGVKGKGTVNLYYGESENEALATGHCETLDRITIDATQKFDSVLDISKAFRYVNVVHDAAISIDSITMLYEYADLTERGNFRCSDSEINEIYDIARYTLRLNSREFFIDGIKRDRWIWSGDANQSYLMNYYLFFDSPTVERTLLALRGKDPVTSHINTIMDYTFYWFVGIYDYFLYTADQKFLRQYYPRMQTLMEYCLSRRNKNGMMEGLAGDWIFIDWAEGLSKKGEVSFEQLLLCRSLEAMSTIAKIVNDAVSSNRYAKIAEDLRSKIFSVYWNDTKQALVHSRVDGKPTDNVTRYANMFAIFFDYLDESRKAGVKKNVLLNPSVPKITTPYMRFYELEALCALGEQGYVLKEMKDYWGGMLKLGATSFWEEYNPSKSGAEHLAMYGRPFGKSLCHAWGASPIYLLGKYYIGVKPLTPGYETYLVEPELGGLKWMQGKVPTPRGSIDVYCDLNKITVRSSEGTGVLKFRSTIRPRSKDGQIHDKGNGNYEMAIEQNRVYSVSYKQ